MLVSLDSYLECLMAHMKPVSPPWSPTRRSGRTMAVADWDRTATRQLCPSMSSHPLVTLVFLHLLALSQVISLAQCQDCLMVHVSSMSPW